MASVRLRKDQIERLRKRDNASADIRYAVKRWKRGDFTIASKPIRKKGGEVLQVFPVWKKIEGVEDWQLRQILDIHWSISDDVLKKQCDEEMARLDREIAEMMRCLPPFIIETPTDR